MTHELFGTNAHTGGAAWDEPGATILEDIAALKRQVMADVGQPQGHFAMAMARARMDFWFRHGAPRSWPTRWGRKVFDGACFRPYPFFTWRKHMFGPPKANTVQTCARCGMLRADGSKQTPQWRDLGDVTEVEPNDGGRRGKE